MKKRVIDIEKVIDHHFNMIKATIKQDKIDRIQREFKKKKEEEERQMKDKKDMRAMANDMGDNSQSHRS